MNMIIRPKIIKLPNDMKALKYEWAFLIGTLRCSTCTSLSLYSWGVTFGKDYKVPYQQLQKY